MHVRAASPGGEAVAKAERVRYRFAVLGARHAIARSVVCIFGGEAVEVVVGVGFLGRLGHRGRLGRIAERVAARRNAPERIVLVGEAAEGCAVRCAPRYVCHAVHDVMCVLYHKSAGICYGGEPSVPSAVAEPERDDPRKALHEKDECAEGREHDPEADLGREHVALGPARHLRGVGTFRREHEDRDEGRDEGEVIDGEKSE